MKNEHIFYYYSKVPRAERHIAFPSILPRRDACWRENQAQYTVNSRFSDTLPLREGVTKSSFILYFYNASLRGRVSGKILCVYLFILLQCIPAWLCWRENSQESLNRELTVY